MKPGRRRRLCLVLAAAAMLLAACVPVPRTVTVSPNIVGTLQSGDGTPIIGEHLILSLEHDDSTCSSRASRTTTDSRGWFNFSEVQERQSFTPIMFEQLFCSNLCADSGLDGPYLIDRLCYLHRVPETAIISCIVSEIPEVGRRSECISRGRRPE
jgi:hypothetical protein